VEVVNEAGGGERRRRVEEALLDVVGGEHGDVPGGEGDELARAGRRLHRAPPHHAHRRRSGIGGRASHGSNLDSSPDRLARATYNWSMYG
jgi:hypothetical protein